MRHLVHLHQSLAFLSSWPPQISVAISLHNSPKKILQAIADSCLPAMKVPVEHTRRGAVGQLPDRHRALLQRRKSESADVVFPKLEVYITSLQRSDNAEKKISPHSNTAVKNHRAPPWFLGKIVYDQTLVSYAVLAGDKCPTSNRPTDPRRRCTLALHLCQAFRRGIINAIEQDPSQGPCNAF